MYKINLTRYAKRKFSKVLETFHNPRNKHFLISKLWTIFRLVLSVLIFGASKFQSFLFSVKFDRWSIPLRSKWEEEGERWKSTSPWNMDRCCLGRNTCFPAIKSPATELPFHCKTDSLLGMPCFSKRRYMHVSVTKVRVRRIEIRLSITIDKIRGSREKKIWNRNLVTEENRFFLNKLIN